GARPQAARGPGDVRPGNRRAERRRRSRIRRASPPAGPRAARHLRRVRPADHRRRRLGERPGGAGARARGGGDLGGPPARRRAPGASGGRGGPLGGDDRGGGRVGTPAGGGAGGQPATDSLALWGHGMCGISGFVNRDRERPADEALLRQMTDAIAHRGPDGTGHFVEGPAALGHRRLAIIDLSQAGAQPMQNEDGTVTVTFNGEIYNYLGLREELIARGHVFRSRCDTEVLVHGYEEWGDALPERLGGMFAFAIWDARRQRLLLARELWKRLQDATEARLMADVPVGVFLSGGLDSSCIAAQMIDLRKARGEGGVKSFSVGYLADDGSSELDQARRVARALGTEHR